MKIDFRHKYVIAACAVFSATVLILVLVNMGPLAMVLILALCYLSFSFSQFRFKNDNGDDILKMRIQALEIEKNEDLAMIAILSGELDPSDI